MTKSKRFSRIISFALAMMMAVALAVPTFAINSSDIIWDASHGRQLGCDSAGTYVLNQYTSAQMPQSGTTVTTWTDTRAPTQFWEFAGLNNGGTLIIPWNNHALSFNIYWASSNPEVNLYTIAQNGYYDAAITFESQDITGRYVSLLLSATPSASYGKRYVSITAQPTAASDGKGTSKIVRWQTTASRFYDFDNRQVVA